MKTAAAFFGVWCLWLAAVPVFAAEPSPPSRPLAQPRVGGDDLWHLKPRTLRSQTGQFIVSGVPWSVPLASHPALTNATFLRLDPAVLAVSCERIKQTLLTDLGLDDQWQGTIHITLQPVREDNEPIVVTSVRHADGWSYHVEIPELANRARLVKALVQVLLMEIANRKAGEHPAELPPWLVEGMPVYLQASAPLSLTLEPHTRIVRDERGRDPLRRAREQLRARPALTFNQMNWPTAEELEGDNAGVYQSCAHLFIHELLRLPDGRARLRAMLFRLAEHLNWQTAFLRAFNPPFQRLIDVDKWWALNVVNFTGRDPLAAWPHEEVHRRLEEILATPVQVHLHPKELPLSTQARLQSVIAEWDYARQAPVLAQKVNHLQALQLRSSYETRSLVDQYRQTLESYLQKRGRFNPAANAKASAPPGLKSVVADTLKRLDELDARRAVLSQSTNAPAAHLTAGP